MIRPQSFHSALTVEETSSVLDNRFTHYFYERLKRECSLQVAVRENLCFRLNSTISVAGFRTIPDVSLKVLC